MTIHFPKGPHHFFTVTEHTSPAIILQVKELSLLCIISLEADLADYGATKACSILPLPAKSSHESRQHALRHPNQCRDRYGYTNFVTSYVAVGELACSSGMLYPRNLMPSSGSSKDVSHSNPCPTSQNPIKTAGQFSSWKNDMRKAYHTVEHAWDERYSSICCSKSRI